jgi:hypothetical protein
MSYGTDIADLARRAATYVDRILRGAKVSELPVHSSPRLPSSGPGRSRETCVGEIGIFRSPSRTRLSR